MVEKPLEGSGENVTDEETVAFEKDYDAFWGKGSSRRRGRVKTVLGDTPPYTRTIGEVRRVLGDTPLLTTDSAEKKNRERSQ